MQVRAAQVQAHAQAQAFSHAQAMGGHANASMLAALAQGDTRHSPHAPFQRRAHNGGGAVAGSAAESAAPPVLDHGAAGSIQSHLLRLQLLRMVAPRVDARPLAQPLSLPLDVHGARARTPASRLTAALPVSSPSLPSLPPMSLWAARNAAPVSRPLGTPLASPAASNVLSHVTMATATGAPGVPAVATLQRPVTAVVTSAAAATSAVVGPAAMSTALHAARVPPAPATSLRMAAAATHGAGVHTSHPAVDTGPAVAAVDPSAVHLQHRSFHNVRGAPLQMLQHMQADSDVDAMCMAISPQGVHHQHVLHRCVLVRRPDRGVLF